MHQLCLFYFLLHKKLKDRYGMEGVIVYTKYYFVYYPYPEKKYHARLL